MAAWRWWFGLSDYEAGWLGHLYRQGDAWTSAASLADRFRVSAGQVRCMVHRLRAALEVEAIDSEPGLGYRLTDSGRGECQAALWRMGERLRAA